MVEKVKVGYKQTEVGVIPKDWDLKPLSEISYMKGRIGWQGLSKKEFNYNADDPFLITGMNFKEGSIRWNEVYHISEERYEIAKDIQLTSGDVLMTKDGTIGKILIIDKIPHPGKASLNSHLLLLRPLKRSYVPKFLFYLLNSKYFTDFIEVSKYGTTFFGISQEAVGKYKVHLPKPDEQLSIAEALSDTDALIESLDNLIAKKKMLKQGTMQELLTGKRRLPGFNGEWVKDTLNNISTCHDNLRVPLNENQRTKMSGDIPYCGANGIVGYVNDYVVDDDVILVAEDGGYFDEYQYRPIAYRMIGKCWVNNHAHIIKANENTDQGFLYYSLVHKNILPYINSGTRAKLNKSELNRIEIEYAVDVNEQNAIFKVLSEMDEEIELLEKKRDKYKLIKLGMMQELLTGRIRLV